MRQPHTIWAPDGTKFVLTLVPNDDIKSIEQAFDQALLSHWELRGPDENSHLWLANHDGELVSNPSDDDVPKEWTLKAQIAVRGWIDLRDALAF